MNRLSNFLKTVSAKTRPVMPTIFWLTRHEQLIRFQIKAYFSWPWGS